MEAPSSSSITSRVDCALRKQDAAFLQLDVIRKGSDLQGAELSLNQKMPLYTCQQEDYLTMLLSEVFKVINLLCNT